MSLIDSRGPRIVADAGIPALHEHLEGLGHVRALPAGAIDRAALRDAHVLLIRSISRVDASLLEGTSVEFVGSATSGTDHVDRAWLRRQGIAFAHAKGANAESVVDYVVASLLRVAARRREALRGRTVGIVGCGHIGGRLARRLPGLGLRVLLNDPPKERRARLAGRAAEYVSLDRVVHEADILTLHTPLTRHGRHATHHLVDARLLRAMRSDVWLVNTARGGVVDEDALLAADPGALVVDVWQEEPTPRQTLVDRSDLATAHIAGYALDSKIEATRRMARAVARHFGLRSDTGSGPSVAPIPVDLPTDPADETAWLDALARVLYPVERDDAALRGLPHGSDRGAAFESLRSGYPVRRLFSRHAADTSDLPEHLREAVHVGMGLATKTV